MKRKKEKLFTQNAMSHLNRKVLFQFSRWNEKAKQKNYCSDHKSSYYTFIDVKARKLSFLWLKLRCVCLKQFHLNLFHDLFFKNFEGYFSLYVTFTFSKKNKKLIETIDVRHARNAQMKKIMLRWNFRYTLFYQKKKN